MIQHTYSNYIKDGYAHHPQIEASHPTYMIDDKGHLSNYETRIELKNFQMIKKKTTDFV